MRDLLHKRLRWIVVMRHMRPWGHLGLLLTQGLPWSLLRLRYTPQRALRLVISAPVAIARCLLKFEVYPQVLAGA